MPLVLIVEDNKDTYEFVGRMLSKAGIESSVARNGQEALDLLRKEGPLPALILLDLMMPVMNGWEFISEMREDARFAGVPVIVCSSVEPGGMGRVGFLKKPIDAKNLVETVRAALTSG